MKKIKSLILIGFIASFCFLTTGCTEEEDQYSHYDIVMTNTSGEATHMFVSGEGFDASNKLESGASRTRRVDMIDSEGLIIPSIIINVSAGRNGVVLASKSVTLFSDSSRGSAVYKAVFNGSNITIE